MEKTIPEIVERLRKLNVPDELLNSINQFYKESICPHESISDPVYGTETWIDKSMLIAKPRCYSCGKFLGLDEIKVLPGRIIYIGDRGK